MVHISATRLDSTRPAQNFFAAKNSNSTEKITQLTEKNYTTEKITQPKKTTHNRKNMHTPSYKTDLYKEQNSVITSTL